MLYTNSSSMFFNIPKNIFHINFCYTSYSYLGKAILNGFISPSGCNAISTDKRNSFIKSYAESLERRSLMFGGYSKNKFVTAWDLINNKEVEINQDLTRYNLEKTFNIDTTGAAAHINSSRVTINALKELLEKNSLFLFWYGGIGRILPKELYLDNMYYKLFKKNNYEINVFFNNSFSPLLCCFVLVRKNNIIFSGGVGSAFSIKRAIERALSEAYLLKWQNIMQKKILSSDEKYNKYCVNYLLKFPELNNPDQYEINAEDLQNEKELIMQSIPKWVDSILIIYLKNAFNTKFKVVKLFSEYLNNHIPKKSRINLNNPINKNTININSNDLKYIPDCIFI